MNTPTLRPLSTGELLDRTFTLYRSHFLLFAGIAALTNLAALAVQLGFLVVAPEGLAAMGTSMAGCGITLAWLLLNLVVTLAVAAASQGATIVAVSHVYLGRPITALGALSHIRGRIVAIAVTLIVLGIACAVGFLLLIVPGVILSLMWALTVPVAVLESRDMLDAASRSAELTKGDRFRVFVVYAMFFVVVLLVSMLLQVPIELSGMQPGPGLVVASSVASFLAQCLVGPLMTIGFALLYYDERVRKEAFDLQLMMEAIDGGAAAEA